MNNYFELIQNLINKIFEFSGLNENQKVEFIAKINEGLIYNLIEDGKEIVSSEIFTKLKSILENANSSESDRKLVISAYLKELSETEQGKEIITNRLEEVVILMTKTAKEDLTEQQKQELLSIIKQEYN